MIAVFGANGKTGSAIIKNAQKRGIAVQAIAKNDHDTHNLRDLISVNEISYADADHVDSIRSALKNASAVISCIDARTAGYGCPAYRSNAAANIVNTAHELGIKKILHLSVMGAYRWSPNPLNRQSFHLDIHVRRSHVPWTMLRVSCYHDELIDAHIAPPDGRTPHPIRPSSRYSPISRNDFANVILNIMPDLIPSRTWLVGGPEVFTVEELIRRIKKYKKGSGGKTQYGPLPHGDMSIPTETTLIMVGSIPKETLEWSIDPSGHRLEEKPFWNRSITDYHPADQQAPHPLLSTMNRNLRYAVHKLLVEDLKRIGIEQTDVSLSFKDAEKHPSNHTALPHKALMLEMSHVAALSSSNEVLHKGDINFIYDDLADEFQLWWAESDEIPKEIWDRLDVGVRRRLQKNTRWKRDPSVLAFVASTHQG